MSPDQAEELLVVGVDGSANSRDALRWAVEQARRISARVRVVGAWTWPALYGYAMPPPQLDPEGDTRRVVDDTVLAVFDGQPDVPLERWVQEGAAAPVLLGAASDADLLVVGTRGRGAFAGMLLGSVSSHVVNHARCPVVVVPAAKEETPER